MRLVNVDELVPKHFVQRTDKIIGYAGTQPIYEYVDVVAYDIDSAPTVKAIPVEWIEEWGWKNGVSESMSLRVMIDDWEKENDNQERPL